MTKICNSKYSGWHTLNQGSLVLGSQTQLSLVAMFLALWVLGGKQKLFGMTKIHNDKDLEQ